MSDVLPKEKQTAYERWELASFGDERASAQPVKPVDPQLNSAQLAIVRERARLEGYADGVAEGRAVGLELGRADAAGELMHLQHIAQTFGAEVAQANEVIAEDLMDLALDLAKAMLRTALDVRPELVLPIVGEAIRYLPSLQQPALLFLNPDDAALVKTRMDDELTKAGWRVAEDIHMERGGCRIETASNQIDATATVRWQRIAAALGKDLEWLDAVA